MKRFLFLLLFGFLFTSCARVGSPVGGSRDSIPPQVIGSNIDSPRTNVSRNIKELRIDFDEYINLKEISRQLIISPPIKKISKILPSGIANKFLLIKWDDTLQENTTYNFNFGNAIVDNNEGNALGYYNFAFSTGEKIDSLFISGDVKKLLTDTEKGGESKNIVVGLYQQKDSMDFRQKPYYITMADPDGYFELNYLAPGKYRVLAFEDSNANSVYDPGKEQVGFLAENVNLDKSISGLQLSLVPSQKSNKYLEMKEVPGGILMNFEGNPEKVEVLSLNEKLKDYKITHAPKSDSVFVWFNAKQQNIGIESNENLKFSYDNGIKQDTVSLFYRYNTKNEMLLSNARGNLLPPQKDFVIRSNYYINEISPEKWTLSSDSIQQNFTAEIAKENPFEIHVKSNFAEGKKYSLSIPKETVSSYYESLAKSYRFDFESDKTENYGSFSLTLVNTPVKKFWTQLISANGEVAYSKYGTDPNINFSGLKPEKYQLRILVDENENGVWDRANFAENIFAEPVYTFEKAVEIRPLWEIKETWTLPTNSETSTSEIPEKMPEKPVINKP